MTQQIFHNFSHFESTSMTLTADWQGKNRHKVRLKQLEVLKSGHLIKHKVKFKKSDFKKSKRLIQNQKQLEMLKSGHLIKHKVKFKKSDLKKK